MPRSSGAADAEFIRCHGRSGSDPEVQLPGASNRQPVSAGLDRRATGRSLAAAAERGSIAPRYLVISRPILLANPLGVPSAACSSPNENRTECSHRLHWVRFEDAPSRMSIEASHQTLRRGEASGPFEMRSGRRDLPAEGLLLLAFLLRALLCSLLLRFLGHSALHQL